MGRDLGPNPARYNGPCRPGTKLFRVVPCLGRAFFSCFGPAHLARPKCTPITVTNNQRRIITAIVRVVIGLPLPPTEILGDKSEPQRPFPPLLPSREPWPANHLPSGAITTAKSRFREGRSAASELANRGYPGLGMVFWCGGTVPRSHGCHPAAGPLALGRLLAGLGNYRCAMLCRGPSSPQSNHR
jgi:hypothetical protein